MIWVYFSPPLSLKICIELSLTSDLDNFCFIIQRELHEITAVSFLSSDLILIQNALFQHSAAANVSDYVFTSWNQPFAPADRRTAAELKNNGEEDYLHSEMHGPDSQPGMMSIQRTLLKSWKDVDTYTREV